MHVFDTPDPISVTIELGVGDVRIAASDRADTVVDVRPTDEHHEPDVQAAEQTRVEYTAGNAYTLLQFELHRLHAGLHVEVK